MTPTLRLTATGIDLRQTLGALALLRADPTTLLSDSAFERATITPEGAGVISARWQREDATVSVSALGPGTDWLLARAPALLGPADDVSSFDPDDPVVSRLWARFRGDRIPRTGTIWHDIGWTIVQQRVHRRDAASQWIRLVNGLGAAIPGVEHLKAPPEPRVIAQRHPSEFRQFGIDSQRSRALISAAQVSSRLDKFAELPFVEVRSALLSIPGIGPWTAACLQAFT